MHFQNWTEWVLPTISLTLVVVYHLFLYYEVKNRPQSTLIGISNQMRAIWVESIINERRDILAIQTLRNWTMAATFLASTAILIWLALLHFAFGGSQYDELQQTISSLGTTNPDLWMVKLVTLLIVFFFVFFNFTMAIRHFNHVGFMINLPPESDPRVNSTFISHRLNSGATHHTIGMRGYYISIPLTLWLANPWFLLVGMIVMMLIVYRLDHKL